LSFLNKVPLRYQELVVVDNKSKEIVNYFCLRKKFKVVKSIKDKIQLEKAIVMCINYLADLHKNKHLFHGDIKPGNLFMCNDGNGFITSDSGSLILLDDPKAKYYV
jgi:hypothetical protein